MTGIKIMKKVKPATEIRNLKRDLADLQEVCKIAGWSWLVIYLPQIVLKTHRDKPTKEEMKWVKEKVNEYQKLFPLKKTNPKSKKAIKMMSEKTA